MTNIQSAGKDLDSQPTSAVLHRSNGLYDNFGRKIDNGCFNSRKIKVHWINSYKPEISVVSIYT